MIVITLNRPYFIGKYIGHRSTNETLDKSPVSCATFEVERSVRGTMSIAYLAPLRMGIRLMAIVVDIPYRMAETTR
jgi:hypothetical protein